MVRGEGGCMGGRGLAVSWVCGSGLSLHYRGIRHHTRHLLVLQFDGGNLGQESLESLA